MRQYRQLSYREMVKIQIYLEDGIKRSEIAIRLSRNKSTISRLIRRNQEEGCFKADRALEKIAERKHKANAHPRILDDSLLKKFILEKIETFWTPEQIAGRWKKDTGEPLSHETIYRYIYTHHPELVRLHFRRKGKRYRNRKWEKLKGIKRGGIKGMRMIESRPETVDERKEVGHWEGDSIVGKKRQQIILTNVERKSGYLLAAKSSFKTSREVAAITKNMFEEIPDELRITLTLDQGMEFARHRIIEDKTKMTVYFCHKSSPWERGINENANGLLRWFIPKGTDFEKVSEKDLCRYVDLLNSRPRKRLNFLTPAEVFLEEVRKKSCSSS